MFAKIDPLTFVRCFGERQGRKRDRKKERKNDEKKTLPEMKCEPASQVPEKPYLSVLRIKEFVDWKLNLESFDVPT